VLGFDDSRSLNINMVTDVYLTREFTKEGCGRFYQQHGISYQFIKRERRKHLTINGVKTAEVDFSGLHINLLYVMEGIQNELSDCYMPVVEGLIGRRDDELREAIKQSILVAINAPNFKAFVGALNSSKEIYPVLHKFGVRPKAIITQFSIIHPHITKHLNTNASILLQYKDSNIIQEVLLKLKKEKILGVPLHDSIICQKSKAKKVKKIMEQTYKKMTGFNIIVKIK
jgi:hypothetical protein